MTSMGDQAQGLRKLRAGHGDQVRVIAVTGGGGAGKTSAVVNLAAVLARNGLEVLILDENPYPDNVAAHFGLMVRYDLRHLVERDKTLEQIILSGPAGISLLPAAHGMHALTELDWAGQQWLIECFGSLPRPVDVVLVDSAADSGDYMPAASLAAQEVIVVLSTAAASITDAYALIKRMSQEYARRHFRVLVNKAGSEQEAAAIFGNIRQAARRHLTLSPDFIGSIPLDYKLQRAAHLCRPVVEVFPTSAAAAGYRKLAEELRRWPANNDQVVKVEDFMQRLMRNSHLGIAHGRP